MRRLSILLLLAASCGGSEEENAAKDRAAAQATWALVLKVDGAEVRLPLQIMNIMLNKRDETAPESFEIVGPGVTLLGEIPNGSQVGYGEKWEKIFGKTIAIKPSGEFDREPKESAITFPGKPEVKVLSGSIVPQSMTGKWSGQDGDKTLKGTIKLLLADGRSVEGTFAVLAITWG